MASAPSAVEAAASRADTTRRFLAMRQQPGNARCAECHAADTSWVVLDHGVLVCVRCAGAHRGLGTHISKVRSTAHDQFTASEHEWLESLGNAKNAYTLYGSTHAPLIMPAAWKCDCAPFGSDIGGTNPAFWPFKQEAQWDSWLTVGVTDGNSDGAITTIGMSDQWSKWCAVTPAQAVLS